MRFFALTSFYSSAIRLDNRKITFFNLVFSLEGKEQVHVSWRFYLLADNYRNTYGNHFSRSYENHSNGSILRNYDKDWKSLKGELHLECSNKRLIRDLRVEDVHDQESNRYFRTLLRISLWYRFCCKYLFTFHTWEGVRPISVAWQQSLSFYWAPIIRSSSFIFWLGSVFNFIISLFPQTILWGASNRFPDLTAKWNY